ncbi:MAG: glycosyltransferase family 4 protein [Verrucomicrobia bacterium]|nr:glycosyltransferase family 4 protein [Verrucomicrobiota bacterium]
MKIAIFTEYPPKGAPVRGGVAAVAVALVGGLTKLPGLDVHVIWLERGRTAVAVEQDGSATIHRLPGSRWPHIADILFGPGKRRLLKYLDALQPDIVHFQETYGLVPSRMRIPSVFTVHGFDHLNVVADNERFGRLRSFLWRHVERFGLARHRHVISITPYVRAMIEPITTGAIYDIDNPIDETFFTIQRRERPGRLLYVGTICERKDTLAAVRAVAIAVQNSIPATLEIAGGPLDGPYYEKVKDFITDNHLEGCVTFLGHASRELLRQKLAEASALVLPSWQENAPMAIAEAMAAGVPVLSTNCCGMPYMVTEGVTGYLVAPGDYMALADRISRLISNDPLRKRMGEAACATALQRFHPNIVATKTYQVYLKVAGSNQEPGV